MSFSLEYYKDVTQIDVDIGKKCQVMAQINAISYHICFNNKSNEFELYKNKKCDFDKTGKFEISFTEELVTKKVSLQ